MNDQKFNPDLLLKDLKSVLSSLNGEREISLIYSDLLQTSDYNLLTDEIRLTLNAYPEICKKYAVLTKNVLDGVGLHEYGHKRYTKSVIEHFNRAESELRAKNASKWCMYKQYFKDLWNISEDIRNDFTNIRKYRTDLGKRRELCLILGKSAIMQDYKIKGDKFSRDAPNIDLIMSILLNECKWGAKLPKYWQNLSESAKEACNKAVQIIEENKYEMVGLQLKKNLIALFETVKPFIESRQEEQKQKEKQKEEQNKQEKEKEPQNQGGNGDNGDKSDESGNDGENKEESDGNGDESDKKGEGEPKNGKEGENEAESENKGGEGNESENDGEPDDNYKNHTHKEDGGQLGKQIEAELEKQLEKEHEQKEDENKLNPHRKAQISPVSDIESQGMEIEAPKPNIKAYDALVTKYSLQIEELLQKLRETLIPVTKQLYFQHQGNIMSQILGSIYTNSLKREVHDIYIKQDTDVDRIKTAISFLMDISGSIAYQEALAIFTVLNETFGRFVADNEFSLACFATDIQRIKTFFESYETTKARIANMHCGYGNSAKILDLLDSYVKQYAVIDGQKYRKILVLCTDFQLVVERGITKEKLENKLLSLLDAGIELIFLGFGCCEVGWNESNGINAYLPEDERIKRIIVKDIAELPEIFFNAYLEAVTPKTA